MNWNINENTNEYQQQSRRGRRGRPKKPKAEPIFENNDDDLDKKKMLQDTQRNYTVDDDLKILRFVELFNQRGKKGNPFQDPGIEVILPGRSIESMRDRYKRFLRFLKEENMKEIMEGRAKYGQLCYIHFQQINGRNLKEFKRVSTMEPSRPKNKNKSKLEMKQNDNILNFYEDEQFFKRNITDNVITKKHEDDDDHDVKSEILSVKYSDSEHSYIKDEDDDQIEKQFKEIILNQTKREDNVEEDIVLSIDSQISYGSKNNNFVKKEEDQTTSQLQSKFGAQIFQQMKFQYKKKKPVKQNNNINNKPKKLTKQQKIQKNNKKQQISQNTQISNKKIKKENKENIIIQKNNKKQYVYSDVFIPEDNIELLNEPIHKKLRQNQEIDEILEEMNLLEAYNLLKSEQQNIIIKLDVNGNRIVSLTNGSMQLINQKLQQMAITYSKSVEDVVNDYQSVSGEIDQLVQLYQDPTKENLKWLPLEDDILKNQLPNNPFYQMLLHNKGKDNVQKRIAFLKLNTSL